MSALVDWLVGAVCRFDDAVATSLGLTPTNYALASAIVTIALAWGFLAVWLSVFGKLRSVGLARRQQRLVWWFVFTVALFQMGFTLGKGIGIDPIPCPWSAVVMPVVAVTFLAWAYGLHVEDGNKANLSTFLRVIAMPALGEVAMTAKWTADSVITLVAWVVRHA
jgi:hypothetical protein